MLTALICIGIIIEADEENIINRAGVYFFGTGDGWFGAPAPANHAPRFACRDLLFGSESKAL